MDVLPYKMQYHTSRGRCLELGGTGEGVGRGQRGKYPLLMDWVVNYSEKQKPVAETSGCVAPTQSL